jgi:hypothetical protein
MHVTGWNFVAPDVRVPGSRYLEMSYFLVVNGASKSLRPKVTTKRIDRYMILY